MTQHEEDHIRHDARMTAVYLTQLVAQNIPIQHAVAVTIEYVRSMIMTRHLKDATRPPKEPWE